MFEIIPSPGTKDKTFEEIEKKLLAVRGLAKSVHIDIIDGYFADNKTFSNPAPFKKYSQEFNLEIHLMVHEPVKHIKPWADIGATRFIGQIEKMENQADFIAAAQLWGEASLGVDLDTDINNIKVPFIDLDAILMMGVRAGFSGQKFDHRVLEKVKKLRGKTDIPIEIDGGINEETLVLARDAGANRFVATSFVFDQGQSPKEQINLLQSCLQSH